MNPSDDDLRQLLDEATSGIRPQGTFDDIRTRTEKVDPMARRWFLPAIAAAAVVALVIGGVAFVLKDDRSGTHPVGPAGSASAAPTIAAPTTKVSQVYYLGNSTAGPRLFSESRTLHADGAAIPLNSLAIEAANAAIAGKSADPDYRSAWPAGTTVSGLGGCLGDCDIQVNFTSAAVEERPAGMSEKVANLSIEQLVRSIDAARDSSSRVFFTADQPSGGTVRLSRVLGVDTTGTVGPGNDDDVLAPVQITSPAEGAVLVAGKKFTVTGVAAAFEATVNWELKVGGDAVVDSGFAQAAECCTLSPYSFDLTLQPGTYTLVVHDTDMSGAGRPVNQDTKEIVVR